MELTLADFVLLRAGRHLRAGAGFGGHFEVPARPGGKAGPREPGGLPPLPARVCPALDGLCRVLERWIEHFLGVAVTIKPQREIDDKRWVWHVGLDAEASSLLNDLYNGADVADDRMGRLLCLFQLDFTNPADMRAPIAGRPVYLAMAMDADQRLRLKPQNLLLNLPLARQQ